MATLNNSFPPVSKKFFGEGLTFDDHCNPCIQKYDHGNSYALLQRWKSVP
jgi:hypothetical protein